jgi:hypothetical protein
MNHLSPLSLPNITLDMKELTILQAMTLAKIPTNQEQYSVGRFIRFVTNDAVNPNILTAQERTMALCHYLAASSDTGADFSVGNGVFSDYFNPTQTKQPHSIPLTDYEGDNWLVTPLFGWALEGLERLEGEIPELTGRTFWLVGRMASQLTKEGDILPDIDSNDSVDMWLLHRLKTLSSYPEREFNRLLGAFLTTVEAHNALFKIDVDDTGLVIMPESEDKGLPPARFPCYTIITDWARFMA